MLTTIAALITLLIVLIETSVATTFVIKANVATTINVIITAIIIAIIVVISPANQSHIATLTEESTTVTITVRHVGTQDQITIVKLHLITGGEDQKRTSDGQGRLVVVVICINKIYAITHLQTHL